MTQTLEARTVPMIAAAEAALSLLPIAASLTVGEPVSDPAAAAVAGVSVVATLTGKVTGQVAVTVNQELVDALHASPLGQLDLATAVAPALDAVAGVLGAVAGPGQELRPEEALSLMAAAGELSIVPLVEDGVTRAALLLSVPAAPVAVAPTPITKQRDTGVSGFDLLHGVDMEITVELGRTSMTVRDLLSLSNGSVIELDRTAGSPADVLVNRQLIARGEVVVIDEYFGIRITEILASGERDAKAS
ncbi:MAG: flagellar motor switch protein FliN [Labedaea sp.]